MTNEMLFEANQIEAQMYSDDNIDQLVDNEVEPEPEFEDNLSDVEADAMTLASAGMGTDEDYGYFGDDTF